MWGDRGMTYGNNSDVSEFNDGRVPAGLDQPCLAVRCNGWETNLSDGKRIFLQQPPFSWRTHCGGGVGGWGGGGGGE